MAATRRSVVRRGGATQRNWYDYTSEIWIGLAKEATRECLRVQFSLPCSKGHSNIVVHIAPADFRLILKAMLRANQKVTLAAVAKELDFPIADKISN